MIESIYREYICVLFVSFSLCMSSRWWVPLFFFLSTLFVLFSKLLQCRMCVTQTTTTAKSKSEWLINTQSCSLYVFGQWATAEFAYWGFLYLPYAHTHAISLFRSFMHCLLLCFFFTPHAYLQSFTCSPFLVSECWYVFTSVRGCLYACVRTAFKVHVYYFYYSLHVTATCHKLSQNQKMCWMCAFNAATLTSAAASTTEYYKLRRIL